MFFDLIGGALPDRLRASPGRAMYETAPWTEVIEDLRALDPAPGLRDALGHRYFMEDTVETMVIDEVEAIWSAIDTADDWTPLHDKIERVRRMGEAHCALGLLAGPLARPGHIRA